MYSIDEDKDTPGGDCKATFEDKQMDHNVYSCSCERENG